MIPVPPIYKLVPKSIIEKVMEKKYNVGKSLSPMNVKLKTNLYQADMIIEPYNYINICFFSSLWLFGIFMIISTSALLFTFTFFSEFYPPEFISLQTFMINVLVDGSLAIGMYFYGVNYPRLVANRRIRELEKPLMNAFRHVLIKIRSGVPLFNALASLSEGYGEVSKEMSIAVFRANAGVPLTQALDEVAAKNPSIYFRRALWQISNTLKVGADLNQTLTSIVESFSESQIISATKYGRQLNMISMLYMILTVIFPTLGVTFLVILSSFIGIMIDWFILTLIFVFGIVIQVFFLTLIKNKQPSMVM